MIKRMIGILLCVCLMAAAAPSVLQGRAEGESAGLIDAVIMAEDEDGTGGEESGAAAGATAGGPVDVLEGCEIVNKTETLELYYNRETDNIAVLDVRNGYIWTSAVNPNICPDLPTGQVLRRNMNSLFRVSYSDIVEDKGRVFRYFAKHEDIEVTVAPSISGGALRIDYHVVTAAIKFTVLFSIEGDSLNVTVPYDSIVEEGDFLLVKLQLLPYFGMVSDSKPGYVFYPDGSGALYRFDANGLRDAGRGETVLPVYGSPYAVDALDLTTENDYFKRYNNGMEQVNLPVFGLKSGDVGYLAIITQGDTDAGIYVNPSSTVFNANRASCEFVYRNLYTRAQVKWEQASYIGPKETSVKLDKRLNGGDRSLRYCFLDGDEAGYSGMAVRYREYLIETGVLQKREPGGVPFYLDFLMGVRQPTILFDRRIKMTTFAQAREILEYYRDAGVTGLTAGLQGWTGSGYGISGTDMSAASWLGGTSGLKALTNFAAGAGYGVALQANLIRANAKSKGFWQRRDSALLGNGLIAQEWDLFGNFPEMNYLMNPARAAGRFINFTRNAGGVGAEWLVFEDLGEFIYRDYLKSNPFDRGETADKWSEYLESALDRGFSAAVTGGNAYILASAERLMDVPIKSSGLFLESEAVPFYTMVLHGYIPYAANAGNTFNDIARQKLEWVETGCAPYFMLTYETNDKLINTDYNRFFSTYYEDWIGYSVAVWEEFNGRLSGVYGRAMVAHERLPGGLTMVTYDNGARVYINYTADDIKTESGETAPAMDYIVVKG